MAILRAAAWVSALSGAAGAADISPAGAPGACKAEGEGDVCSDHMGLLQMISAPQVGEVVTVSGEDFTWRVKPAQSSAVNCDEVCDAYGTTCVATAFYDVTSATSVRTAKIQATGSACPGRLPVGTSHPAAPFFGGMTNGAEAACRYPRVVNEWSACRAAVEDGMMRICPCSVQVQGPPTQQCKQLRGIYCQGKEIECNCNYCDDFKEDTPCANTCRVMNGYIRSPYDPSSWSAKQNTGPRNVPNKCDCQWMRDHGDDCKKCDDCAYQCRKQNPFPRGTCRG